MELLKELKERATAETNPFWKKVQIVGACAVGLGTLIITAPFTLPAVVVTSGSYIITIGTTIAGIAQLTKK